MRTLTVSVALAAALLAARAQATVIEALTLRELVLHADVIAQAQVITTAARMDELDRIVTDVTLRVDEPLWGARRWSYLDSGSEVVVTRLGGELDGLGLRIEGEPTFALGETVVLFAEERRDELHAVGMSQGVLPVRVDPSGTPMVLPGGDGLSLVAPGHGGLRAGTAALSAPRALPGLLDEVRALVAEVHGAR
jgi:hypothetical protein